jgi:hypothetical protein
VKFKEEARPRLPLSRVVLGTAPFPVEFLHLTTYRDGNDGPWSTFNFLIGSQGQAVHLLPATYFRYISLIPREGCPDLLRISNCSVIRGNLYNTSELSDHWASIPDGIKVPTSESFGNFNTTLKGIDVISIGSINSPHIIKNQAIGFNSDLSPFVGLLGLSVDSSINSTLGSFPDFVSGVVNSSQLTVPSWSYTAGSYSRQFYTILLVR